MENQSLHTVFVNLFNQTAQFSRTRLSNTQRDPKYHWYEIRHSDIDMSKPSTIEEKVVVNHCHEPRVKAQCMSNHVLS